MLIRTKILATVGPACRDVETLLGLFRAGCDACRINFSHGTDDEHQALLDAVRAAEDQFGRPIAVVADLCGPKIRVGTVAPGTVLTPGETIVLQRGQIEGSAERISTTLPELVDDVQSGQAILLDDGKLRLAVEQVADGEVVCRVERGGPLSSGKGINLPQTQLNLSPITDKDRRDIAWIASRGFDYVALSFVQKAEDIEELRGLLAEQNCDAHIIAKIEKPQALDRLAEIVRVSDAVMVARGDLGVEMDLPSVPVAQKRIVGLCQQMGTPCIVATQMLESMMHSAVPTRAEVSDVANAVLDHADAVMLSGETAVGDHPIRAVEVMNDVVQAIQDYHDATGCADRVVYESHPVTAAVAGAVREIIDTADIALVVVYTAIGDTARMISKNRPACTILALAPTEEVCRRVNVYYGVVSAVLAPPEHTRDVLTESSRIAVERGLAEEGDRILVVSGRPIGTPGNTNTLVIHTIGDDVS